MKHVFYIPASYSALIYAIFVGAGLLLSLYVGVIKHPKELLITACGEDHYEFWPSISTTIGDTVPERQIWRISFVLCAAFRLGTTITLFYVFWLKGCGGLKDLYTFRKTPRQFIGSSAFVVLLMLWVDLWRLIAAVIWTYVASNESLAYHNIGFGAYIVLCFLLQVTMIILVKRNLYNLSIYASQHDARVSFLIKRVCMWGETTAAIGVVGFFLRHFWTCAPGSYSLSTMCEWSFATFNIFFDASAWYELKQDGWWLSGPPSFYARLWESKAEDAEQLPATAAPSDPTESYTSATPLPSHTDKDNGSHAAAAPATTASPASAATTSVRLLSASGSSNNVSNNNTSGRGDVPSDGAPDAVLESGEAFLANNVILHRFTFCCAPSRLTMWICDIYWSYLLWGSFLLMIQHMYFMPLIAMSLSWEVCVTLSFAAPCLLRIPVVRRWLTGPCIGARSWLKPSHLSAALSYRAVPMYVLLYFVTSLSHLHMLVVGNPRLKVLTSAVACFSLTLATFTRCLYPSSAMLRTASVESNEDSRRTLYALPLGLVLSMMLRILYVGHDPMHAEPFYSGTFGIILGLAATTFVYRHAMFGGAAVEMIAKSSTRGDEGLSPAAAPSAEGIPDSPVKGGSRRNGFSLSQRDELMANSVAALGTAAPPVPTWLLGLLLGLTFSLTLTFHTSANYIPRLLAIDPYPASLFVVGAFVMGLYCSPDVLPIIPAVMQARFHSSVPRQMLRRALGGSLNRFGAILIGACLLMVYGTRQTNFSFATKSINYNAIDESAQKDVSVKYWGVQESFRGSKHLAFVGGLIMTFCVGALLPVVMELCFSHTRARRLAQLAESLDPEAVYRRESRFFTSLEFVWYFTTKAIFVFYVLCVSYPFVPMGWLFREKSHALITLHVLSLWACLYVVVRRIRRSKYSLPSENASVYKQRSMQLMIVMLVVVAFVFVVIGRVSLQPDNISYPMHKRTAVEFPNEVIHLHHMLMKLRVQRNGMTDPLQKAYKKAFVLTTFEAEMAEMDANITQASAEIPLNPVYKLDHLSKQDRLDVWEAAKAMTFFSGMIWTVHFGLDNANVDSFSRIATHAQRTEAGVIGILESDSMHLTNGNRDMVEYIAYHLGYRYTDYGPTALDNTYGCAMISRYPILKVRRYVMPSPMGELACMIHAELDVFGLRIQTFIGHFGNTEHWADGLLQSQFLGKLITQEAGPLMLLSYLVTYPGNKERYHQYADPYAPGKLRDPALELYTAHPWVRLRERGGYEETPPATVTAQPGENVDFNVEYKLQFIKELESGVAHPDASFRRTPPNKPPRYFFFNDTGRYTVNHPRFEFVDRYCQYALYKRGTAAEELPAVQSRVQPLQADLFDWWRIVDKGVETLSDTEIQVLQLKFSIRSS